MKLAFTLIAVLATLPLAAQTPAQDYAAARKILLAHSPEQGFLTDDSPQAITALQQMNAAVAAYITTDVHHNPNRLPSALSHDLCLFTVEPNPPEAIQQSPEELCDSDRSSVIRLAPSLYAVAPLTLEIGTVFLLNTRTNQVVWSITNASAPHNLDPHDLVGAWSLDRTGMKCRDKGTPHKPGACGPLYASLILLPSDSNNHPRFAIDANYSQGMGATIAKQTSIWTWNAGAQHADLLWDTWYDFMIDQPNGTTFDRDSSTLIIGEKGYFRSTFDCGECITRPLEHRVLLTATGIDDLGTRSLVPELEAIDNLFWRIAHHQPTAAIASPQVVRTLTSQVASAKVDSAKVAPDWFTVGMVESPTVHLTATGATVCFEADGLDSAYDFTLRCTADLGYFITRITSRQTECPGAYFGPPPPPDPTPASPPKP